MIGSLVTQFAASCKGGGLLGFPTWYKYLDGDTGANGLCSPKLTGLSDVWLIAAAVIEIMLRIAALAAVFAVVYGGFNYITSQGEPDKTSKARTTIINGVGGLLVAILAGAVVGFVAGSIN